MIMADVFAAFGTLLALGMALPGLFIAWRVLLPGPVERASTRLHQTPWRCFFLGLFTLGGAAIPIAILFNLAGGGLQALGWLSVLALVTLASVGAAGLAGLMGTRLQHLGLTTTTVGATVRGAVVLELAAIFPFIGWLVFMPVAFIVSFGAAVFALFGWMPRLKSQPAHGTQEAPASA